MHYRLARIGGSDVFLVEMDTSVSGESSSFVGLGISRRSFAVHVRELVLSIAAEKGSKAEMKAEAARRAKAEWR